MATFSRPWAWRNALLTTLRLALAAWVVMLAGLAALQANCSNTGSPAVRVGSVTALQLTQCRRRQNGDAITARLK